MSLSNSALKKTPETRFWVSKRSNIKQFYGNLESEVDFRVLHNNEQTNASVCSLFARRRCRAQVSENFCSIRSLLRSPLEQNNEKMKQTCLPHMNLKPLPCFQKRRPKQKTSELDDRSAPKSLVIVVVSWQHRVFEFESGTDTVMRHV